jgi:hypothetical protein
MQNYFNFIDDKPYLNFMVNYFGLQITTSIGTNENKQEVFKAIRELEISPMKLYEMGEFMEDKTTDEFFFDILVLILSIKGYYYLGSRLLRNITPSVSQFDKIVQAYSRRFYLSGSNKINNENVLTAIALTSNQPRDVVEMIANKESVSGDSKGEKIIYTFMDENIFSSAELEDILRDNGITTVPSHKESRLNLIDSIKKGKKCNPVSSKFCDEYGDLTCSIVNRQGDAFCVTKSTANDVQNQRFMNTNDEKHSVYGNISNLRDVMRVNPDFSKAKELDRHSLISERSNSRMPCNEGLNSELSSLLSSPEDYKKKSRNLMEKKKTFSQSGQTLNNNN